MDSRKYCNVFHGYGVRCNGMVPPFTKANNDESDFLLERSRKKDLNYSASPSKVLLIKPHVQGNHGPYHFGGLSKV